MSELSFRIEDVMACAVAAEIPDDAVGFVGVGSGGRAFTCTFGVPVTASCLAQRAHAPNFKLILGSAVDPKLDELPSAKSPQSIVDLRYHHEWPTAARLPAIDNMDTMCAGRLDVSFPSAAQIDPFGNINITAIGPHDRPKVRLVGCLAQPELLAFARKPIVVVDQTRRIFVEKVDFITSVGHLRGGRSREEAGLNPGGPAVVVTNLAVLDFHPTTKRMRVRSIHPDVTRDEVLDNTGFELECAAEAPTTPAPTPEQLRAIRSEIDPFGVLLEAGPAHVDRPAVRK